MPKPLYRTGGHPWLVTSLTAVLAVGLVGPGAVVMATSATAAAGCSTTTPALGSSMTCSTPGTETITIPATANSVAFTVIGGGGGAGIGPTGNAGDGGNGAVVTGTLDLSGLGSTLDLKVGSGGTTAQANYQGGTGGDHSALLTSAAVPLVVAGGGGGGGGANNGSGGGGNAGDGVAAGGDGAAEAASANFAYGGTGATASGTGGTGGTYVDTFNPSPPNPPNMYNAQGSDGQTYLAGGNPTAPAQAAQGPVTFTSGGGGGGYGSGGSGALNTSIGSGGGGAGGSFVSTAVSGAGFSTQNDGGNQYCYYASSCPAGFQGIHGYYNLYPGYDPGVGQVTLTFALILATPVLVNKTPPLTASTTAAYAGYTFTATGGPAPTYTLDTGALPPGLSLDSTTGVLSGTPTSAGSYPFTVRATNSQGSDVTASIVLVVTAPAPPPPPAPAGPAPQALNSTGAGSAPQQVNVSAGAGETVTLLQGGQPVTTVTVPGAGTYTLETTTKVITFTPVAGYLGTPTGVTFRVTNAAGTSGTALYTPTVTKPAAPTPTALSSSGSGVQHATITHHDGDTLALLDSAGTPATTPVTITGEGTYTLDPTNGIITFTPATGFTGTGVGVGFQITDAYGQNGMAAYVPTIATTPTPAPTPTPPAAPTPKPLPKIDRKDLAKIPANPKKVTGKERTTKAFNSSFTGIDAHPIDKLGTRQLKKGQATTLSGDGLFDFDSAKLTKKGRAQVKAVVFNLKGSKAVNCEGYTDYAGARNHELDLSSGRAKAVCAALKIYGAKVSTKTKGYGPQRPVVVGGTAKGRKENRRVVILITR